VTKHCEIHSTYICTYICALGQSLARPRAFRQSAVRQNEVGEFVLDKILFSQCAVGEKMH
jgi:hypothetical protein